MSESSKRILITGAAGQLGRLVIDELLQAHAPDSLVAMVRNETAGKPFTDRGVAVALADYDKPETLQAAFQGVDRVLLISSTAIGKRVQQHKNVLEAARAVNVELFAYTSILAADTSSLQLAHEHRATEELIIASGIPYTLLRNGWYTENYTGSLSSTLAHGAELGSSSNGKISAAARADYASAAAVVLANHKVHQGKIYELAGDDAFTLEEYAAEVAKQSGKPIIYKDLPEAAFKDMLVSIGLPSDLAEILADSSAQAAKGGLFNDAHQLSRLIGRPTTSLTASIAQALGQVPV
jgi:NAD(P)H dehydrogenase (quinone)